MALKLARGFFRLWIALSILWISGVGLMAWWTSPVHDVVPEWAKTITEEVPEWAKKTPAEQAPFDPDAYLAGKVLEKRRAIKFVAALALIPPRSCWSLGWSPDGCLEAFGRELA